jgi:hypothetical protein
MERPDLRNERIWVLLDCPVSGPNRQTRRRRGRAGGGKAEDAGEAPSERGWKRSSAYAVVLVSDGAGRGDGGVTSGSSGAGFTARARPRNGCRWNSVSFSARMP